MDDLPCRPEQQAIGNLVPNRCYPAFFMETVTMNPQPVRTLNLLIHKPAGRVPQGNPCSPREGNAEQPQPVIDPGPFCHLNGLGSCNVKVELRADGFIHGNKSDRVDPTVAPEGGYAWVS